MWESNLELSQSAKYFQSNFLTSKFSKRNMELFSLLIGYIVIYILTRTNYNLIRCGNVHY